MNWFKRQQRPARFALYIAMAVVLIAAIGCQNQNQAVQGGKNAEKSQSTQDWAANDQAAQPTDSDAAAATAAGAPEEPEDPNAPKPIVAIDFENNGTGLWSSHSGGELAVTDKAKHGGTHSLEMTGRQETFDGPALNIAQVLTSGQAYQISVWVMYSEGPATHPFVLSDEQDKIDGTQSFDSIVFATLTKGKWTHLKGQFTFPDANSLLAFKVYVETAYKASGQASADDVMPFYIDDFALAEAAPPKLQEDVPSLREAMAPYFPIGAAIEPEMLDPSDPNNALLIKHYSSLTPGNFMKPDAMEPTEGAFQFATADKLVQFARQNDMLIRGHNLLWHNQMPGWYFTDPNDASKPAGRDVLLNRLKTYISTVVGHYKGKIQYWDAVNEVLSDRNGGLRGEDEGSHWTSIVGDVDGDGAKDDFIRLAFQYAHQADPDAKLVINDYNLVSNAAKQDAMYELVKHLLAQKTPIHAVGMQMHVSMFGPDAQAVKDAIERFASLGVKVEVTELDMSIYQWGDKETITPTSDILLQQAKQYKALFDVFKEEAKKGNLESVTLWGSADNDTWLDNFPVKGRTDAPLLFDRQLQAKPAFWAIVDPSKIGLDK